MSTQKHATKNNMEYFSQTSKDIFLSNVNADKHKNYLSTGFSNMILNILLNANMNIVCKKTDKTDKRF